MNTQTETIRTEFPGDTIFVVTLKPHPGGVGDRREAKQDVSHGEWPECEPEHRGVPESPLND